MKRKELEQVQFAEWPDSLILSDREMLTLLENEVPDWLQELTFEKWELEKWELEKRDQADWDWHQTKWERQLEFIEYRVKQVTTKRMYWAQSAFMCRSDYPDGFFYACGRREDGQYRHIGFRYGTEPSEYMSGFSGMTYTPKEEKK
jgi:hypothetical protein